MTNASRDIACIGLAVGMSLEAVRQRLVGWSDHPMHMVKADKSNLYHTWDFMPPAGSDQPKLRMTFLNNQLLTWGDAASIRRDNLPTNRTG